MAKRSNIKTINDYDQDMYVSWSDQKSKEKALATGSKALKVAETINRSLGAGTFRNIIPNISIREGLSRKDYEQYRSVEGIPEDDPKEIIRACNAAYKRIGIIRNVIDMMGDFTVKGIRVSHPVKIWEKLGREWANKINFKERSERFVNLLFRQATLIVKRSITKITSGDVDKLQKSIASKNSELKFVNKPEKNVIPYKYTFINPLAVEITDDPLGYPVYWLRVNSKLSKRIFGTSSSPDQQMVALLPPELKVLAAKSKLIQLNQEMTRTFFYKKDDWELWGTPFIYSILDDLISFEKMKLADITALDGAISHVRLWKLGDVKEKIMPTPAAVARLADMLANAGHGGTMDLIWDATLTLEETQTDVHQFLGKTKYEPVLENIYSGLGIPPSLTGSSGNSGGFTNNFISLRTLTERLGYARDLLISFWIEELKLLQLALGIIQPFHVEFDRISLTDEAAEKALLIQLADRNLISVESIQRQFGEIPEIASLRIRKQEKMRKSGKIPPQASPFHNAHYQEDLGKIALQTGQVVPSQLGMELNDKKPGEITLLDHKAKELKQKTKGVPGQGRPKNSKDSKKRKQKRVVPRTRALVWAKSTQRSIDDILTPVYLEHCSKANLRQLTNKESEEFEELKFAVLANTEPFSNVNENIVNNILSSDEFTIPESLISLRRAAIVSFVNNFNKEPTMVEVRDIEANIIGLTINGVNN